MILNNAENIKYGSLQAKKIMRGTSLIWELPFDSDYQAILDYATLQGYTLPSESQRLKQNQLVIDLKNAGVWSKLDTFANFATDGDVNFALIDWKRLTQYTAVNSPTRTINEGFNGNGISSYVDTNFDLSNLTTKLITNQQSISTGMYINQVIEAGTQYILGNLTSSEFRLFSGNETRTLNRYMGSRTSIDWSGTGLMSIHRNFNALTLDLKVYNNENLIVVTGTGNGYPSITGLNILIGRYVTSYNENQFSFFYSGSSMVAEISDFSNALNTYMSSI
jgi:hypothetical protein